uniref:ABC transporter ATP-binding protein n=1 Tax=Thermogladius calderae TaxID=1200300 RepID=A0A7J3XZY0_9CREN
MLVIRGLSAGYSTGSGKAVIEGASLDVGDGEVALLTGASGSGKTTMILALTGVLKFLMNGVVSGVVELDGLNPLSLEGFSKLPAEVGVVLQDPDKQIAMPTPMGELVFTLENLGYSTRDAVGRSTSLLQRFGLASKASQHVDDLSLGEKRKLTIASAIIHEPSLVILDEPTASLDPWSTRTVVELVSSMKKSGSTILVVEHKPFYFKSVADKIFTLENGRVGRADSNRDAGYPRVGERRRRSAGGTVLRVEDLVAGYGEPILTVDELHVGGGEVVAVVGPNGSGKTTLLKTVAGFIKPVRQGRIEKASCFYLPQHPDFTFISTTVERELRDAARSVGFSELASLFPWFKEARRANPFTLSHGQRRWLANLVAYGYSRKLILMDEPSTGLDDNMLRELERIIDTLASRGAGVLVSTHDPRLLMDLADRAYSVEGGRLVERDPVDLAIEMYRIAGVRFE